LKVSWKRGGMDKINFNNHEMKEMGRLESKIAASGSTVLNKKFLN
jgi:hypothetical protein